VAVVRHAGQPRVLAQHLHAEGERLDPKAARKLVDEAFGEEGGVAVRARAPAPVGTPMSAGAWSTATLGMA
jgi:hypothetical protein